MRQFIKFGAVGFCGFIVNFVIAHGIQKADPGFPWAGDFAVGFMAGGVSNWYLNRIWTFRSVGHPVRESLQFLSVSAIALGVGEIFFWQRPLGPTHFSETWFLATVSGIFVNFFLNKYWTFKQKG